MKLKTLILLGLLTLLLQGCWFFFSTPLPVSVPTAPGDLDAQAKEFAPPPNKASLYIYRSSIFGAAFVYTVRVNGKVIGHTGPYTYFRLNLMPGKYAVESVTGEVSSLSLSVEAGKNYFVRLEPQWGIFTRRSLLQQEDETTGRDSIMETKLIASSVSDNDIGPLDAPIATPEGLGPHRLP